MLVLGLATFGWHSGASAQPSLATGSTLYNTTVPCTSCHASPPDNSTPFSPGNIAAANDPTLILDAATSPGEAGSCPGNMCTDPGVQTYMVTAAGAAQNRQDVAFYIAQSVAPNVTGSVSVSTAYVTAIGINVTANISSWNTFAGGNASSLAFSALSHGTISNVTADPTNDTFTFTYTPNAAASGVTETFHITVSGPGGTAATTIPVSIAIGVAPPPIANAATFNPITYQTTTAINLAPDITGGPASGLDFYLGTTTSNGGTVTAVAGLGFNYNPPNDFVGTDTIRYEATGLGGTSGSALITFVVATPAPPAAAAPIAAPAAFNPGPAPGTSTSINVTGGFTGPVNSYALGTTSPTNGTVVNAGGGLFTYTPTVGYNGPDTFTVTATNRGGTSGQETVNVTVAAPTKPAVVGPVNTNATYNLIGPPLVSTTLNVAAGFSGYLNSVAIVTAPAHGTAVVGGPGPATVIYTPTAGFAGVDNFTVTASNASGTSPTAATVNVTVPLPARPTAANLTMAVAYVTQTPINLAGSIGGGLTNFTNPVAVVTGPSHGVINSIVGKVVTYTPNALFYGANDTFTYTATGPGGTSPPATVTLQVGLPPPPTANPKTSTAIFDTPDQINLSASVAGVTMSIMTTTVPAHGTVSVSGFTVTYTPASGYLGPDSFSYTTTGPGGTSAAALISITVIALPTVAPPVSITVNLNAPTTFNLANFITGSGITGVQIIAPPVHGSATTSGTNVTYDPANNFFGTDTLTYRAFGAGGTATGVVTLTVIGRPDPRLDPDTIGLIDAQVSEARRFSRVQIGNFQQHMESLHRRGQDDENPVLRPSTPPPAPPAPPASSDGTPPADGTPAPSSAAPRPTPDPSAFVAGLSGAPSTTVTAPARSFVTPSSSDPFALNAPQPAFTAGNAPTNGVGYFGWDPSAAQPTPGLGALTSLDLGAISGRFGPTPDGTLDVWLAGLVNFGDRDIPNAPPGMHFSTDGVSLGADHRINEQLVVGVGVGYARDRTSVGTDGTQSSADGTVVAAYASYQPSPHTFIDSVIGFGNLDFSSKRFVAPVSEVATGSRSGEQAFLSITAGYDYRDGDIHLSPYGRIDLATDRLDQFTENGAGAYDLRYASESVPTEELSLGLKIDDEHKTDFGSVVPHARIEYEHQFESETQTSIAYADLFGGASYAVTPTTINHNAALAGVGVDFLLTRGLLFGVDYEVIRAAGAENSQVLRFRLSQQLDAGLMPLPFLPNWAFSKPSGFNVDAGYTSDDNVTRNSGSDKLADQFYNLDVSKVTFVPLDDNTRVLLGGFVGGDKFHSFTELDQFDYGVRSELQYRPSADFGSPTLALFGRVFGEDYTSDERRGWRYIVGVSAREDLTDRISVSGALSYDDKQARSDVFTSHDGSAKANLDYSLTPRSTFYVSGEYRHGDLVSTGVAALNNLDVAKVFVVDDAFPGPPSRVAYRFLGDAYIATVGYNLALGEKDSLDLSWRFLQAQSANQPNFLNSGGVLRYYDNQISLVYLVRF